MAIRTISAAYFVGDLLIPNISGSTTTEQANLLPLQIAIAKQEPIYLKKLMGVDLYDAYVAGIAVGSPAAKWVTLNNLIYYTNTALTALNTGISPVANYVYFKYMEQNATTTLTGIEGKGTHENFTVETPGPKMVAAWNEMVRLSEEIQDFIVDNDTDYPEFYTSDIAPETFERKNNWGI